MKNIYQFLKEADLENTKKILRLGNFEKETRDELYKEMFNNPEFKTDKRKYRIYLPFDSDQKVNEDTLNVYIYDTDESTVYNSETFKKIVELLKEIDGEKERIESVNYKTGMINFVDKKQISIVKYIQKSGVEVPTEMKFSKNKGKDIPVSLIDEFRLDKARNIETDMMVVITKNPLDVLNKASERKWGISSCYNLPPSSKYTGRKNQNMTGVNARYIPKEIEHGTINAYLTYGYDVNLSGMTPVATIAIKPTFNEEGDEDPYLYTSKICYNTTLTRYDTDENSFKLLDDFRKQVAEFIDQTWNSHIKYGSYKYRKDMYNYDDEEMDSFEYSEYGIESTKGELVLTSGYFKIYRDRNGELFVRDDEGTDDSDMRGSDGVLYIIRMTTDAEQSENSYDYLELSWNNVLNTSLKSYYMESLDFQDIIYKSFKNNMSDYSWDDYWSSEYYDNLYNRFKDDSFNDFERMLNRNIGGTDGIDLELNSSEVQISVSNPQYALEYIVSWGGKVPVIDNLQTEVDDVIENFRDEFGREYETAILDSFDDYAAEIDRQYPE